MRLDPKIQALAEEMKQWRPDSWRRWVDPAADEGRLSVLRSGCGSGFWWYVETRDPSANPGEYKTPLKLAEGRSATLEEAKAAADAAWISSRGPDQRAREIDAVRERIKADQEHLAALTGERSEQVQEVAGG